MKFKLPESKKVPQKTVSVGLDIGHSYLKLLLLAITSEGVELDEYSFQPLPPSPQVSSFLKSLFAEHNFPTNRVNVSLSGKATLVRDLWVPKMTSKELKASIKYELDQYIPFPVEDVYYDSYILEEDTLTRKEGQMRVILGVAKRRMVEGQLKRIKDAGLAPNIIDMDALALYNAFLWAAEDSQKQGTVGLIDIGNSKTIIDIISNGVLTFTREVEYGTRRIMEGVSNGLSVGKDEAEKLVCSGDSRIEGWVQDLVSRLSKELWSSFEYYEGQEQRAIERVYFTGGGSLLLGLVDSLGKAVGLPLELWNPLSKIKVNLDPARTSNLGKIAPLMAVACGLACRGI